MAEPVPDQPLPTPIRISCTEKYQVLTHKETVELDHDMDTDIDKSDQQLNIDLTAKTADIELDKDQVLIDIDIDNNIANASLQKTILQPQEDQTPFVQCSWADMVTRLSEMNPCFTTTTTSTSTSTTNGLSTNPPSRNEEKKQSKNLVMYIYI